jgi:proteasome accessory factor B
MSSRLNNRTDRLIAIEHILFRSPDGRRAVELAEVCEVDRRTVYRDLALLQEVGIPIYQKEGRFYLDRERYTASVRLSRDEAMALLMAASALSQSATQNPHFAAAITKLSQALPDAVALHAAFLSELAKTPKPDAGGQVLATLMQAWCEAKKVKLWTTARDTATRTREFSIYFIEPRLGGTVYVVGYDSLTHRIRAFKLGRIKRVEIQPQSYQIPQQFDPRRYLARVRGDNDARARQK